MGFEESVDGGERAADHADRVRAGWRAAAVEKFRIYAEHREYFTTEDVRLLAEKRGFDQPPDPRAWGAVMRSARKAGYIEPTGRTKMSVSTTSHPTKIEILRSLLFHAAAA